MKKRKGKQPVKPDEGEAMKERLIYLKGLQGSTMNIPIIYRRTFGWNMDSVVFKPINRRSFVVFRPDLEEEEIDLSGYRVMTLDVGDLPVYSRKRVEMVTPDNSILEELRESLVSLSLVDRYVHIDIPRVDDGQLNDCIMSDLEHLSSELGCSYTITPTSHRCTFVFPKYTNEQIVTRARNSIRGSIEAFRKLIDDVLDLDRSTFGNRMKEVGFLIRRAEINIDKIYTSALNVLWDLPQVEPAGHFIVSQSIERIHDEMEYMVQITEEALKLLEDCQEGFQDILFEELVSVWRTSIGRSIQGLELGLEAIDLTDQEAVDRCLEMIRSYREEKTNRSSSQDAVTVQLTRRIEGLTMKGARKGGIKILTSMDSMAVIQVLFSLNQSAARLSSITNVLVTKTLYLKRTRDHHRPGDRDRVRLASSR
ncbi:MAG: hypothetical protein JW939_08255 [Candidatus Thermoplasmatota archaeon]|nr:hypothetical protein [Candidatus Thermoplasmatota archaeon]